MSRLSKRSIEIINLYHKYPDWSYYELTEALYGDGDADGQIFPICEETTDSEKAKNWVKDRSFTKSEYRVKFWRSDIKSWEKYPIWIRSRPLFTKAKKLVDRDHYLREKWRGSYGHNRIRDVIGRHLMRICRAQGEKCSLKALLPEADIVAIEKKEET